MIDLRSDTVTQPTPAMRQVMANAPVGDDVYNEDPTVIQLEEYAAQLVGKEAALFVPSGTMANQIALGILTQPGDEVLIGAGSHCYSHEGGAGAVLNGLQFQVIGAGGSFNAEDIYAAYRPKDYLQSSPTVVAFENTHNRGGGWVWNIKEFQDAAATAKACGMHLHLDGARLFNASVASGVPVDKWVESFDTVSLCLSKGLGAPVGSLVCASGQHIQEAKRLRKMFGGAMRQVGILAAAGLYALKHHVERLTEDHAHAKLFASILADTPGILLNPEMVETNIVRFDLELGNIDAENLVTQARERGVFLLSSGRNTVRAVTHLDVNKDDCFNAAQILHSIVVNSSKTNPLKNSKLPMISNVV